VKEVNNKKLDKLPEALRIYGIDLKANKNYEPFEGLETGNWVTVQMALDRFGNLHFRKGESYEKDLENANIELEEAKKTIKTHEKTIKIQEREIASLKTKAKTAPKKNKDIEKLDIAKSHRDFVASELAED